MKKFLQVSLVVLVTMGYATDLYVPSHYAKIQLAIMKQ